MVLLESQTFLPQLEPDWCVFPPAAEVSVGQRFVVFLRIGDRIPEGCNRGYSHYYGTNKEIVRSTNPSVLAADLDYCCHLVFAGVAPGQASLEAVNLRTPTGGSENVPLTVCSEPSAPDLTCPNRVPLVIRVVP